MIAIALTASLLAQSQTPIPTKLEYNVIMGGKTVGAAEMQIKDLVEEKQRFVSVTMNITLGSRSVSMKQETLYGEDGAAQTFFQDAKAGDEQQTLTALLDGKGAKVKINVGGKMTELTIPLAATAPRSNPSQYWFDRVTPKIGDRISYYAFDSGEKAWRLMTSEYLEAKPYKIGERKFEAHHVLITKAGENYHNWLDSKGRPIAIIQPNGDKLERK
jgi:hypothetical protein